MRDAFARVLEEEMEQNNEFAMEVRELIRQISLGN